ncbi:MAG: hypothetical protein ABIE55_02465 [Candidatus Aenigmatarchaeota archaeon]
MSIGLKPELYSCLKMLETLEDRCVKIYNSKNWDYRIASALIGRYLSIRSILLNHLKEEQGRFIPNVKSEIVTFGEEEAASLIQEILTASALASSYLRSLGGSLEKELEDKKKELGLKEKEMNSLKKILKDSLEAVGELPEVQRSKAVADWKKSHRDIEKNSRKK